jgi:hypothetical protein
MACSVDPSIKRKIHLITICIFAYNFWVQTIQKEMCVMSSTDPSESVDR